MDFYLIGQLAAILTSSLWTLNSILFASAGRRIGAISVNAFRIVFAVLFLSLTHLALFGSLFPNASNQHWLWLGLSGIIGLGVGDFGLFAAFVIIGPRRSVLIMALSPVFAALMAYIILNETLSKFALLGMIVTLVGIIIVILEREDKSDEEIISKKLKIWGVFLAFIGAIGQGTGAVFAKKGIYLEASNVINPLTATLIRMIIAALFIWICVIIAKKLPDLVNARKNSKGMISTAAGAFLGPFLGVTFSMVAVTYTKIGIAQTLMSLMPVMIIPVLWVLYRQKTSLRGIFGAFIAIIGVAILFLI